MNFPIEIKHPTYDCRIPSTNQVVRYRAYSVKEEKILLTALEGLKGAKPNFKEVLDAIKNIISNCTYGKVDPINLTTYDIEFLFLSLRSKAVGNEIKINLINNACPMKEGKEACSQPTELVVRLDEVGIQVLKDTQYVDFDPEKNKVKGQIMLTEDVGIQLRHPSFEELNIGKRVISSDVTYDSLTTELVARCIVAMFDKEQVYSGDDYTLEQKMEFLDGLDRKTRNMIDAFFDGVPKLRHVCKYKCAVKDCTFEDNYIIEGLRSFFT